ncbi:MULTISPECIES: GNAT family N-acetyltransferase [unclassified Amycolatopsis]|uniref:GNAT family N-acetyltransferase n=1 Tax=unclassified Amycolatopsis TaxID=2618356 RepID=UPI002874D942|nr:MULTISPECIES: GNAT family N-acetyltransferase [unclassified Amycolatopsis]MDS0135518.1 GNAT family N-acetyltransferase [Amycolatopsis sp. 505]MDS0140791.1 GNAT family N-acetyltransferase [Amycolatopsis sp. CM201R]
MGQLQIARATPDQAGTLTALMHASSAYQGDYASILDGYAIAPGYVETNPTFIATSGTEILGFYALVAAELDLLFVADRAQGLGIGARLITHMLAEARSRGLESVRVVSHPPALAFYVRMGARRTGTIPARPPKIGWDRPELRFDVPTC